MSKNIRDRLKVLEIKITSRNRNCLKGVYLIKKIKGKTYCQVYNKWLSQKKALMLIHNEMKKQEVSGMVLFVPKKNLI